MSCVKAPDLMTSKKRPVNYFSVRVNDDPVICDKLSDTFEIILTIASANSFPASRVLFCVILDPF